MARAAAARLLIVNILEALRNKSIAVGHLDLRESRRVDHLPFGNDFIAIENESGECVDVARAQRTFLLWRHGAIDVIPNRGGKRPIIGERPRRRRTIERASASHQTRSHLAAIPRWSVA